MRLTTKGRYAVTSMLHLALHQGDGPISLAGISTRQNISLSYLEQLFARLRRSKLVTSVRGPGGGYLLGKPAEHISVAEVIEAVNEHTDVTRCLGKGDCQQGETCLTHHLWMDLSGQVSQFLADISLADLADGSHSKNLLHQQETRAGQAPSTGQTQPPAASPVTPQLG